MLCDSDCQRSQTILHCYSITGALKLSNWDANVNGDRFWIFNFLFSFF